MIAMTDNTGAVVVRYTYDSWGRVLSITGSLADTKTKGVVLPKPRRDPGHHIVVKADPRAAESRKILRDVGIKPITDPRNLVILPQNYHVSLPTTAYHIIERLRPVEGDKAGVEATLASLKVEIPARSAVGIRWD